MLSFVGAVEGAAEFRANAFRLAHVADLLRAGARVVAILPRAVSRSIHGFSRFFKPAQRNRKPLAAISVFSAARCCPPPFAWHLELAIVLSPSRTKSGGYAPCVRIFPVVLRLFDAVRTYAFD